MNKIKLEQQPRKRSNSLPIPKIEITLHDSPDSKRQYNEEFVTMLENKNSPTGFDRFGLPTT